MASWGGTASRLKHGRQGNNQAGRQYASKYETRSSSCMDIINAGSRSSHGGCDGTSISYGLSLKSTILPLCCSDTATTTAAVMLP